MTSSTNRPTRRRFLTTSAAVAASLTQRPAIAIVPEPPQKDDDTPYKIFFLQPAATWSDTVPVGNGRLGACVFGTAGKERIQLNEESIWDGERRDRNNPKAGAAVPEIRELLFAGKIAEAEALAITDMLSIPRRMPCYQTLGDLHLDFGGIDNPQDYRRELNLDTAIASTTFTHEGAHHTREVFSSAPDQVIVIRLTSTTAKKLNFTATLDRPANFTTKAIAPDRMELSGEALPVNDNPGLPIKERQVGIKYYAQLRISTDDGTLSPSTDGLLHVANATTATLFIDCTTNFRYPAGPSAMQAVVDKNITAASARTYADLRSRHIADHQRLFRRAEISFGPDPDSHIPTDKRVQHIKDGGEDIHLLPIYFQYGRYMLISSSRPGTLAANLQGIWNESVDPPWGSKFTININTEMNYWLAERANLSDLHTPLFDLIDSTRPAGTVTAQKYYSARGTVVHHNTDIWGDTSPIDALGGGIWPTGGAWLSLHLWDHYEYTNDLTFLRERAYPRLRENTLFFLDYLVPDPVTGHLVTGPSCSPENKYKLPDGTAHNLCMGPTMDIEIVRALLTRTVAASQLLNTDADLRAQCTATLAKLPPFKIGKAGQLQEWLEDYAENEPGHRHISPLFALFPDDQITLRRTPELAQACRTTLDRRLAANGGNTGWSRSWIINCMARLEDGDAAYASVLQLFRQSTLPNLFDICGTGHAQPFQIDGNLGGPTGLIEMLLQSHASGSANDALVAANHPGTTTNITRLLPALPKAWPNGSFRGLRARGGLEIDLTWENGKATTATLQASCDYTHRIAAPKGQTIVSVSIGRTRVPIPEGADEILLPVKTGDTFLVRFS